MEKIKRIIIELPEKGHIEIKTRASSEGLSIKQYVLKAIARDIYEKARVG